MPSTMAVQKDLIENLDSFYKGLCNCTGDATVEKLAYIGALVGAVLRGNQRPSGRAPSSWAWVTRPPRQLPEPVAGHGALVRQAPLAEQRWARRSAGGAVTSARPGKVQPSAPVVAYPILQTETPVGDSMRLYDEFKDSLVGELNTEEIRELAKFAAALSTVKRKRDAEAVQGLMKQAAAEITDVEDYYYVENLLNFLEKTAADGGKKGFDMGRAAQMMYGLTGGRLRCSPLAARLAFDAAGTRLSQAGRPRTTLTCSARPRSSRPSATSASSRTSLRTSPRTPSLLVTCSSAWTSMVPGPWTSTPSRRWPRPRTTSRSRSQAGHHQHLRRHEVHRQDAGGCDKDKKSHGQLVRADARA